VSFVVGSSVQVSDSSVSFSAERRRIVPRSSVVCKGLPLISNGFSPIFGFIPKNQWVRKTQERLRNNLLLGVPNHPALDRLRLFLVELELRASQGTIH